MIHVIVSELARCYTAITLAGCFWLLDFNIQPRSLTTSIREYIMPDLFFIFSLLIYPSTGALFAFQRYFNSLNCRASYPAWIFISPEESPSYNIKKKHNCFMRLNANLIPTRCKLTQSWLKHLETCRHKIID